MVDFQTTSIRGWPLRLSRCVASVVAWAVLSSAGVAGAQSRGSGEGDAGSVSEAAAASSREERARRARAAFEQGRRAYDAGEFERALALFLKSYDLASPAQRIYLALNLAQTYDRLDRDREALRYYERYLEFAPDGPKAGLARGRVRVLRARLQAADAVSDAPEPEGRAEAARGAEPSGDSRAGSERAGPLEPMPPADAPKAGDSGGAWWPWAVGGGALLVGGAVLAAVLLSGDGGGDDVAFTAELLR